MLGWAIALQVLGASLPREIIDIRRARHLVHLASVAASTPEGSEQIEECSISADQLEKDCLICYDVIQEDAVTAAEALPCHGPYFHSTCVERWKRTSANCPVCRAPMADLSATNVAIEEVIAHASRFGTGIVALLDEETSIDGFMPEMTTTTAATEDGGFSMHVPGVSNALLAQGRTLLALVKAAIGAAEGSAQLIEHRSHLFMHPLESIEYGCRGLMATLGRLTIIKGQYLATSEVSERDYWLDEYEHYREHWLNLSAYLRTDTQWLDQMSFRSSDDSESEDDDNQDDSMQPLMGDEYHSCSICASNATDGRMECCGISLCPECVNDLSPNCPLCDTPPVQRAQEPAESVDQLESL